jgi:hypothetical protein
MSTLSQLLGPDLYDACIQNNVVRVQALTSRDSLTDMLTEWAYVLLAAASARSKDVATYSITQGNTLSMADKALPWIAHTPGTDHMYHFLLESKFVDVNHVVDRTGTLLAMLVSGSQIGDRLPLIEYLLDNGADIRYRAEWQGNLKLLAAAAGFSSPEVIALLFDHSAELQGSGAVMVASEHGKLKNLELLLSRGADVNEMVALSNTRRGLQGPPLHGAVSNDHIAVVDALLKAGADVSLTDAKGRTAADIAVEKGMDKDMLRKLGRVE